MCVFTTGERRSRRARRGRAPLTVASDELLQGLKLRVLEALGVDPRNAAVYVRGRLLDNDDATLAGGKQSQFAVTLLFADEWQTDMGAGWRFLGTLTTGSVFLTSARQAVQHQCTRGPIC